MKYIDVPRKTGGVDSLALFDEFEKEFFPDIKSAMDKSGKILDAPELMMIFNNITGSVLDTAILSATRNKRAPDKIRITLDISKSNKILIFFSALNIHGKPEIPYDECPLLLLNANAEDVQRLKQRFPNRKIVADFRPSNN